MRKILIETSTFEIKADTGGYEGGNYSFCLRYF